ncbi:hypothetical protein [Psychrobacillus sp. NPDC096623]|uniref:hypothetical protein n=1 Tax=Psychrobacillus sp. NPDC096623 TaxID=3364492 RepID=UPI0037F3B4BD
MIFIISEVLWRLHHILMVILFVLAVYRITISPIMVKKSLLLVAILPLTIIIFFAKALNRPMEISELKWLWIELTAGAYWAVFVLLGYIYIFYFIIDLIKKFSIKDNPKRETIKN